MSSINIPPSANTVQIRAIDACTKMSVWTIAFLQPVLAGHEISNMTSTTFILNHLPTGKTVLFDAGARTDIENYSPIVKARLNINVCGLTIDKDIHDIVQEAGIKLEDIDEVIWSHWHWDHHGAPEKLHPRTKIIVGEGFKQKFIPGYPTNPDGIFLDKNFENRDIHEVDFERDGKGLEIGGFRAIDYFGDGSFYLLDTPGHAIGHMCGLARTTSGPDSTFIFLGGDICHFGGSFRPSSTFPIPEPIPCPTCALFNEPDSSASKTEPHFRVTDAPQTAYLDREAAQLSIKKLMSFDADPNVMVCIAHDSKMLETLPVLNTEPDTYLNGWKQEGWKEKARWGWLDELPRGGGKPGREMLIDGVWRSGKRVEDFTTLKATLY